MPTLRDILDALARPGRDPREDLPPPIFKKGILKLEDLQPGMELKGTVLNVVDFGAFVDIGLKDSGLVHISQMANRYIKSPYDVVAVGDVVTVWVLTVDQERRRVSLTMIPPGTERKPPERQRADRRAANGHPAAPSSSKARPASARRPAGRRVAHRPVIDRRVAIDHHRVATVRPVTISPRRRGGRNAARGRFGPARAAATASTHAPPRAPTTQAQAVASGPGRRRALTEPRRAGRFLRGQAAR